MGDGTKITSMRDILPELEDEVRRAHARLDEKNKRIGYNSGLIEALAASIECTRERLDGLERRVEALRSLINEVVTVINKHEDRIEPRREPADHMPLWSVGWAKTEP